MSDCPICGNARPFEDAITCGRPECYETAIDTGLIVEREETPEELAAFEAWMEELRRDAEAHSEWLNSQEAMND
jgi:hypothetical protein